MITLQIIGKEALPTPGKLMNIKFKHQITIDQWIKHITQRIIHLPNPKINYKTQSKPSKTILAIYPLVNDLNYIT